MSLANSTNPYTSLARAYVTESSGRVDTTESDDPRLDHNKAIVLKIVTYLGAAVAIFGISLTILSYVGYRKFHVKRPHIVMVNLCFCLFLYYLAYLISNPARQSPEKHLDKTCLLGVIVAHFSILAAWSWILVYWILLLVMYRRPMGGHISHFFIKASVPAYSLPVIITIVCGVVASSARETENKHDGELCFVSGLYSYLGVVLPVTLMFVPILCVFAILMRGVIFSTDERLSASNSRKNVRRHFIRLTIITTLLGTVAISGAFQRKSDIFVGMIVFGVVSLLLGLALVILFCLHHEEIREHWVAIIRGDKKSFRKHSFSRTRKYEVEETTTPSQKSSSMKGKTPSLYIDSHDDDERKSAYRIVAKEDTDMTTLGLIQIPGTPTTERTDAGGKASPDGAKVRRKKSDAAGKLKKHDHGPKEHNGGRPHIKENETASTKLTKKKSRSSSTPPVSPRFKSTKRQQTFDSIFASSASSKNGALQQLGVKKRSSKRANPAQRLSRLSRKSTSTIDEDSVQLTDFK